MLPKATIRFDNGNLDTVVSTDDGVFGLLASANSSNEFKLNKPYLLKGIKDVAELKITPENNQALYRWLSGFYLEAGQGTSLWIMGLEKKTTPSQWFNPDTKTGVVPASALLDKANGKISTVFTCSEKKNTLENGLDKDVFVALNVAQNFAKSYTEEKAAPFFVILEGYAFNGKANDLPDLKQGNHNRVGIFIGNTQKDIDNASTEVLAGRLSKIAVSKNAGEVKAGALSNLKAFIGKNPVESYDIASLHDKGYITFRTHIRKSGYYISDTPLATNPEKDDYHNIELRRTIDKAYRLAYNIVSNEINTDFDLNNDGTISPFYAKAIETAVESEIYSQMTQNSELSKDLSDKDDLGVVAKFDTQANVSTTNTLKMTLRVRPRGYARWFEVNLGFTVTLKK